MENYYKIRFGYHKCLTNYMNRIFNDGEHFLEHENFVKHIKSQNPTQIISVNNTLFKPDRKIFDGSRIVHLIRHPKDLIVSGYFYHKRGAEPWAQVPMPYRLSCCYLRELRRVLSDEEKLLLKDLPSMQTVLESLDVNKGMMLEIIWRKFAKGFDPVPYYQYPGIRTFKFEEIMQDPHLAIEGICSHWQLADEKTAYYLGQLEEVYSEPTTHMRDSSNLQYKKHFDKSIDSFFESTFHGMQLDLDYPE